MRLLHDEGWPEGEWYEKPQDDDPGVLLSPALSWGQVLAEGRKLYAEHCAACHGVGARGTPRGSELAANRRRRGRSTGELSALIRNGVPTAGMPAFDLPAGQIEALAAFLRSLNSPAAESPVPGDAFCPTDDPANWDATAFSPVTRLYYVMTLEQCGAAGIEELGGVLHRAGRDIQQRSGPLGRLARAQI